MMNYFSKNKKATRHWLGQRLSALLMVGLGIYFFIAFANNDFILPSTADGVDNNMVIAIAVFFWVLFDHGKLGLAVIIEDYVHGAGAQKISLLFNNLFGWLLKILTLILSYYIFKGGL